MNLADKEFMKYWEANRIQEKRSLVQIMVGLPLGLVFGLPILLSFLLRGWYKRMPFISNSQFIIIIMAIVGIVVFYGIYRMKFKWELNEQRYNELIALQKKEQNQDAN